MILRITFPVFASARNRSIEKRSRSEKNMIFDPSGLNSGLAFSRPPLSLTITGRANAPGICVTSAIGFVGGELRLVPELGQLFFFDAENLLERALDAVASQRLTEHVADDPVAVFAADEGPDGLAVAVGK